MTRTELPTRAAGALMLTAAFLVGGCATTGTSAVSTTRSAATPVESSDTTPPTADRQAILSLVGEFGVTFAFEETVALADGYERFDPKRTGAVELLSTGHILQPQVIQPQVWQMLLWIVQHQLLIQVAYYRL